VSTLVERDGCFPRSLGVLARRYALGRLSLDHVRTEFRAQMARFRGAGLTPTHVDTHKHVHCLPGVLAALADVAAEGGVCRARLPYEESLERPGDPKGSLPRPSLKARLKRQIVGYLCRHGRAALAGRGLRTTDHFVGIEYMDALDTDRLRYVLSSLREGVTEVMCHPGYADAPARQYSRTPPHREIELAALTDPTTRADLESRGIQLVCYADI
jgi:predicted glycoside hydrolase/deacetylase ChbG (UPF0249 family)